MAGPDDGYGVRVGLTHGSLRRWLLGGIGGVLMAVLHAGCGGGGGVLIAVSDAGCAGGEGMFSWHSHRLVLGC